MRDEKDQKKGRMEDNKMNTEGLKHSRKCSLDRSFEDLASSCDNNLALSAFTNVFFQIEISIISFLSFITWYSFPRLIYIYYYRLDHNIQPADGKHRMAGVPHCW